MAEETVSKVLALQTQRPDLIPIVDVKKKKSGMMAHDGCPRPGEV